MRLQVQLTLRRIQRLRRDEPVEVVDLLPGQIVGVATAHPGRLPHGRRLRYDPAMTDLSDVAGDKLQALINLDFDDGNESKAEWLASALPPVPKFPLST